ncbi:MAG: hypothetical protein QMC59_05095 [Candidatus Poseidoniaceae archaeon]|jgi:hypothetical protein|tara:strand:- start:5991 stop:6392 length:402 start_codon:yes stop_codon:yes gene_type:complete
MVEIKCPHCDEAIELDDGDLGLFECPLCQEDFEWNPQMTLAHEELFRPLDFWIGSLVPFLSTCMGLFLSLVLLEGWDILFGGMISIGLWPTVAIGIGIYGVMTMRRLLWLGAAASLAISGTIFLIFLMFMFIS